jgi:hypothetical protein
MKRWKKLLLILLIAFLLSQIPFAYRRYKLGRLHTAIQLVNSQRRNSETPGYVEHTGVMHVHSFLGGHSKGSLGDIIAAAQSNHLDFVVMTEHPSKSFSTAEMTLKGEHGGVLFINGNEVRTSNGDRLLLLPGDKEAGSDSERSTSEVLARRQAGLALAAYPGEFKSWDAKGLGGVEVYNVYTDALQINPVVMFFDGLWSYRSYPDLLFATFYRKPVESLKKWDDLVSQTGGRLIATAGNDSHANIGISLNDSSGKTRFGLSLDPYERSFKLVRVHVLTEVGSPPLNEESLLSAVSAGHCFIGFDLFGDTTGFRFTAEDGDERKIMGDEIELEEQVALHVRVPVSARVLLLKDGAQIQEVNGVNETDFVVKEKGSYRVEVYLPQLGQPVGDQPWIISNPIYVR